jgi:hypothetical protein
LFFNQLLLCSTAFSFALEQLTYAQFLGMTWHTAVAAVYSTVMQL